MRFTLLPTQKMVKIILAFLALALVTTVLLERFFDLEPGKGFGEKGPVTFISVLQLATTGCLLMVVFSYRQKSLGGSVLRSPALVWAIMAIGFLFLACDEKFQIHEGIDHQIHLQFDMETTALSDRIDDAVIAVYGLISCFVMYCFRNELSIQRRALPCLLAGLAFFVATVVIDFLTNEPSVLPPALDAWISGLGEEGCKLFAEGMFLAAAYDCCLRMRTAFIPSKLQPEFET